MQNANHKPQKHRYSRLSDRALRLAASFIKSVLVYVLSFVLATQPLLAQTAQIQADANAAAANRPTVGTAANGVPLVNITAPNAAGLSHNKYQQFNVGTPGAILNNSNTNVAQSQLGGLI